MQTRKLFQTLMLVLIGYAVAAQTKTSTAAKPATTTAATEVLTNKSIIDLQKAGFDNDLIITKINTSAAFKFDLSTDGLIELKKQGVTAPVIKVMMEKGNATATGTTGGGTAKKPDVKTSAFELVNHIYAYYNGKQAPKALEKSIGSIHSKSGMFSGSIMVEIDGAKAALRMTPDEASSFAINTGGAKSPELTLYKVKSVKQRREVATMKSTPSGVKTGDDAITTNITRLSEGIYLVSPGKTLAKGEYFITINPGSGDTTVNVFSFGVD